MCPNRNWLTCVPKVAITQTDLSSALPPFKPLTYVFAVTPLISSVAPSKLFTSYLPLFLLGVVSTIFKSPGFLYIEIIMYRGGALLVLIAL